MSGIVEDFRTGLYKDFVEAINRLTQAAKAWSRGCATDNLLTALCHLICGKLKHLQTNPLITVFIQTAK